MISLWMIRHSPFYTEAILSALGIETRNDLQVEIRAHPNPHLPEPGYTKKPAALMNAWTGHQHPDCRLSRACDPVTRAASIMLLPEEQVAGRAGQGRGNILESTSYYESNFWSSAIAQVSELTCMSHSWWPGGWPGYSPSSLDLTWAAHFALKWAGWVGCISNTELNWNFY